jgi:phenylacetate-coenzyme A ligase PaaK-like adenylate-forming protein
MTVLENPPKAQQFKSQEAKLKETLALAINSPMYKNLWSKGHFNPKTFKGTGDLNKVPYLDRKVLFNATKTKPNSTCVGPIGHWFLGYDRFDIHEWYPYSNDDFWGISSALSRLSNNIGLRAGDIVLAVVDTPPRISSFIPFLWNYAEESRKCGLEFINGSMEWYDSLGMSWITFIQKRRPTAIIASRKNAFELTEKLEAMGTSVKTALPDLRLAIFFGEGNSEKLTRHFSIESYEVYSPIENMEFWSECKSHSGIHVWLDNCIPEILPEGEKTAELLSKSAIGKEGELFITNFFEALPLVRYKTGRKIRVEATSQCACGSSSPRIKFIS